MANEKRLDLISRQALIAEYDRVHIGPPGGARKLMEDAPTVDAVEVVRCKDCKHYCQYPKVDKPKACFVHPLTPHFMLEDGFCSNGERREGE